MTATPLPERGLDNYKLAERRIARLQFGGPNYFTCEVEGWAISAPNRRRLRRMLRQWFKA